LGSSHVGFGLCSGVGLVGAIWLQVVDAIAEVIALADG